MSKAERRKRARQRAKDRIAAVPVASAKEGPAYFDPASGAPEQGYVGGRVEASPPDGLVMNDESSSYITGPIVPSTRSAAVPPVRRVSAPVVTGPDDGEDDDPERDDDDELVDGADGDDGDDGEDGEDDDDEDEDGEEDEDTPEDEAVFNVACAAVEQGDSLSWNEVVTNLCIAEIEDPRLGLLVALLVEGVEGPQRLTGDRVLSVMTELGLGDIVEEAKEVTSFSPDGEGESPEDRAIVRENARVLEAQAKSELANQGGVKVGKAPKGGHRPLRASDIRAQKTALSSPGLLGSVAGRGGQKQ